MEIIHWPQELSLGLSIFFSPIFHHSSNSCPDKLWCICIKYICKNKTSQIVINFFFEPQYLYFLFLDCIHDVYIDGQHNNYPKVKPEHLGGCWWRAVVYFRTSSTKCSFFWSVCFVLLCYLNDVTTTRWQWEEVETHCPTFNLYCLFESWCCISIININLKKA